MYTRIKMCGMKTVEETRLAIEHGVHALGLNFFAPSPRYIDVNQAQAIRAIVPPFVSLVGVFVNHSATEVNAIRRALDLDVLQFHGDESAEFCAQFNQAYIKAIRVQAGMDVGAACDAYPSAAMILLDTYHKGLYGGTGDVFDWQQIPKDLMRRVMLAGGLSLENVGQAIQTIHPYALDVCGGIETEKGVKDPQKIIALMKEVHRVNTD